MHINEVILDYEPREEILPKITAIPGEPEMTDMESAFLCGLLKQYNPQKVVEVGIASGATSAIILQSLSKLEGKHKLLSIDLSERFYRDHARQSGFLGVEAEQFVSDNVEHVLLLGDIACSNSAVINDIDFLILDTIHCLPGEALDFLTLLPFTKDGACVVLHDVKNGLASRVHEGYATSALLASVKGEKYINYTANGNYPNIAAFIVSEETRKAVFDILLSLTVTWKYLPSEDQLKTYRNVLDKYYDKELLHVFDLIVMNQRNALVAKNKKWRFPFSIVEPNEKIVIYGAGKVGREFYYQACISKYCEIVAWVDINYENMPWYKVESVTKLNNISYSRIVIAIEDEEVAQEIREELHEMGIDDSVLIWRNPLL